MRRLANVLVAVGVALAACGDDDAPLPAPPAEGPSTFTVMTQNLSLGADLALALRPGADVPQAVDLMWETVEATDFPARAKVIADTIRAAAPDVVALQEVSLWRTQAPGDGLLVPDATAVAYDFLDTLAVELAARGLSYRVAATIQNVDVELAGASGTDYRLTDRDALLVKSALPLVSASSGTFPHLARIEVPSPVGAGTLGVPVPRGWTMIELRAGGRTVRLVNTHLEAYSEEVAAQQAADLVALAQPAAQPTILLGDMNLAPGSTGYGILVGAGAGLVDAWTALRAGDPGLTCCLARDLVSGAYTTRIDLVLATEELRPTRAVKVNETERTPEGLAPSDHAGVVVEYATSAAP